VGLTAAQALIEDLNGPLVDWFHDSPRKLVKAFYVISIRVAWGPVSGTRPIS